MCARARVSKKTQRSSWKYLGKFSGSGEMIKFCAPHPREKGPTGGNFVPLTLHAYKL